MANSGRRLSNIGMVLGFVSFVTVRKLIVILAAMCLVLLLFLLFYKPERSILVEADTRSVDLTFLPGNTEKRSRVYELARPRVLDSAHQNAAKSSRPHRSVRAGPNIVQRSVTGGSKSFGNRFTVPMVNTR